MIKGYTKITLIFMGLLLAPFSAASIESHELIEKLNSGSINWSTGTIEAAGTMAPFEKDYGNLINPQKAFIMALNDAYRNLLEKALTLALRMGYHNLLEVAKAVRIDSSTMVRDFAFKNDVIMAKIEGMIKDAKMIKKEYLPDGSITVTLQMSLYGGFSQLVLPQEIKQLESVKPVKPASAAVMPLSKKVALSQLRHLSVTGVVVDARGIHANPAMLPIIQDENGQEVFGPPFVSREFAIQHGISGYTTRLEAAQLSPRVAGNPLIVKGLRSIGSGNSIIVISNADASRLRSDSSHLNLLKKCRIVIVIDKQAS
jgi:hypothetical protein